MPQPKMLTRGEMLTGGFTEGFVFCHLFTQYSEGGWCHLQGDSGGETLYGIARNYNPKWTGWSEVDIYARNYGRGTNTFKQMLYKDIAIQLSAANLFYAKYYLRSLCQEMPNSMAACVYDFAVHAGPARSIKTLQKALTKCGLSTYVDGKIGKQTLSNIQRTMDIGFNQYDFIKTLLMQRIAYYQRSESQYKGSWLNRVSELSIYLFAEDVTMQH